MGENWAMFSSKCFFNISKLVQGGFDNLQRGNTLCSVIWIHCFYCCSCIIFPITLSIAKHFSSNTGNCKELLYKIKHTFDVDIVQFSFSNCHHVWSHESFCTAETMIMMVMIVHQALSGNHQRLTVSSHFPQCTITPPPSPPFENQQPWKKKERKILMNSQFLKPSLLTEPHVKQLKKRTEALWGFSSTVLDGANYGGG